MDLTWDLIELNHKLELAFEEKPNVTSGEGVDKRCQCSRAGHREYVKEWCELLSRHRIKGLAL